MADACDPGDADIYSPPCRDRAGVEKWRLASNPGQILAMVPGIALVAGTFHRHRPATWTHSFAGHLLNRSKRQDQQDCSDWFSVRAAPFPPYARCQRCKDRHLADLAAKSPSKS